MYGYDDTMVGGYGSDFAAFQSFMNIFILVMGIFMIISIVSMWKIFKKAGEKGWKSLVPIYNSIILMKISHVKDWMIILLFIPIVNSIFAIYLLIKLAKSFGKSTGFALGMLFLPIIFYPILAFNKNITYQGLENDSEDAQTNADQFNQQNNMNNFNNPTGNGNTNNMQADVQTNTVEMNSQVGFNNSMNLGNNTASPESAQTTSNAMPNQTIETMNNIQPGVAVAVATNLNNNNLEQNIPGNTQDINSQVDFNTSMNLGNNVASPESAQTTSNAMFNQTTEPMNNIQPGVAVATNLSNNNLEQNISGNTQDINSQVDFNNSMNLGNNVASPETFQPENNVMPNQTIEQMNNIQPNVTVDTNLNDNNLEPNIFGITQDTNGQVNFNNSAALGSPQEPVVNNTNFNEPVFNSSIQPSDTASTSNVNPFANSNVQENNEVVQSIQNANSLPSEQFATVNPFGQTDNVQTNLAQPNMEMGNQVMENVASQPANSMDTEIKFTNPFGNNVSVDNNLETQNNNLNTFNEPVTSTPIPNDTNNQQDIELPIMNNPQPDSNLNASNTAQEEKLVCPKCGSVNSKDAKFCVNCGNSF